MKHEKKLSDDAALAKLEAAVDAVHLEHAVCVGDIMSTDLATCRPNDTLNHCAHLMWERACGCVPVVDADGQPLSIVTDRDVCMAAYIQGKPLGEILVESVMSKRLFKVGVGDRVWVAEGMMRRHGVRRLLVVGSDGKLAGLLSIDDILGHAGKHGTELGLSETAVAQTLEGLRHVARTPR